MKTTFLRANLQYVLIIAALTLSPEPCQAAAPALTTAQLAAMTPLDPGSVPDYGTFFYLVGANPDRPYPPLPRIPPDVRALNPPVYSLTVPTVNGQGLLAFIDLDLPEGDHNGITFRNTLTIPAGFSGEAKWAQVLNSISVTFQDATQTYTRIQNGPPPYGDYPIPYQEFLRTDNKTPVDSPVEVLYDCFQRCTRSDDLKMWMMFEPPDGVWVPLRAVEWSWSGSAIKGPSGWALDGPGTNTANPPDHDEQNYPVWNSDVRNKHYNPPRPCGPPD